MVGFFEKGINTLTIDNAQITLDEILSALSIEPPTNDKMLPKIKEDLCKVFENMKGLREIFKDRQLSICLECSNLYMKLENNIGKCDNCLSTMSNRSPAIEIQDASLRNNPKRVQSSGGWRRKSNIKGGEY